ncbi:MAG: hypothetical protein HC854_10495 [Flavobacterium sp.]|nr:hypothetical protein [Flavobacterium sp.]
MERRKFVKKLSAFTAGSLVLSGTNIYASDAEVKNSAIDFSPYAMENKILLKGNFIDAETLQPIQSVKLFAKVKRNRLFPVNESLESKDGYYKIESGFTKNKKKDKVAIQIIADGYKTYENNIYLTTTGCHIHSDEWNYNPNFNYVNCPKNESVGNQMLSTFNFHLVKA